MSKKNIAVIILLALLVLIVGRWVTKQQTNAADRRLREDMLAAVSDIAGSLNTDMVRGLSFTPNDKNNPNYHKICGYFKSYSKILDNKGIWTAALKDSRLYFGPEYYPSAPSEPGTLYELPSKDKFEIFYDGRARVAGPLRDEFGTFVTAAAPIKDARSGKVLMIVGLDVAADDWVQIVAKSGTTAGLITIILIIGLAAAVAAMIYREKNSMAGKYPFRHFESLTIFTVCCSLVVCLSLMVYDYSNSHREDIFKNYADIKIHFLRDVMNDFRNHQNSISRFFASSEEVERDDFGRFVRPLTDNDVIRSYRWVPAVAARQLEQVQEKLRGQNMPNYHIWEPDGQGGKKSVENRDVYYPIYYSQPLDINDDWLGLDLGALGNVKKAIDDAVQGRSSTFFTSKYINPEQCFMLKPVFSLKNDGGGLEGLLLVEFCPNKLVAANKLNRFSDQDTVIGVGIADINGDETEFIASCACPQHHKSGNWNPREHKLVKTAPLFIANHTFAIICHSTPEFYASHPIYTPWITAIAGFIMSAILAMFVDVVCVRHAKLESMVWQRTRELDRQRENIAITLQSIGDGVIVTDNTGKVTTLNHAAEKITGWDMDKARGARVCDVFAITDSITGKIIECPVSRALESDEAVNLIGNTILINSFGKEYHIDVNVSLIKDSDGVLIGTVLAFHDVSEQHIMRQALAESEMRLRSIFENSISAIALHQIVLGKNGAIEDYLFLEANSAFEEHTGLKVADIIGRRVTEVLPGIEKTGIIKTFGQVVLTGRSNDFVFYSPNLKKSYKITAFNAGKDRFAAIFEDISSLLSRQEQLKMLSTAVEYSGSVLVITDVEGKIEYVNPSFTRSSGYEAAEVVGLNVAMLKSGVHDKQFYENLWSTVSSGNIWKGEFCNRRKNGQLYWESASIAPMFDENGVITRFVSVKEDITELKRVREELAESEKRIRAKLDAILLPEGDIDVLELADVIDVPVIQEIMDCLYHLSGIGAALVDDAGKVLASNGWQDVCVKFHRANPETRRHCIESDTELTKGVAPGTFKTYKCKNGMWDICTPIMIGAKHKGNFFVGQFFFEDEKPDYKYFTRQAEKYGFDKKQYLEALSRVPVLKRSQIDDMMGFYSRFIEVVSRFSYSNIKLAKSVTEQQRSRQALKESQTHYKTLADSGQALVWTSGLNKECDYFNEPWLRFTGRKLEQELGIGWTEGIHPDDFTYCLNIYNEAFDRRKSFSMEYRLRRYDGQYRWIEDKGMPRYDSDGEFIGYIGHCIDITERKEAERELEKHRQRLILATSGVGIGIWDYDIVNDRLEWDDMMFELYGVDKAGFGYKISDWLACVAPQDKQKAMNEFARFLQDGDIYDLNFAILKKGRLHYITGSAVAEKGANGEPVRVVGINFDVTEHRAAEMKIKDNEALLKKIFDTLPVGLWTADKDGQLVSSNKAGVEMWGIDTRTNPDGYKSFKCRSLPSREPVVLEDLVIVRTIKNGETIINKMLEIETARGERKIIIYHSTPVVGDDGQIKGAVIVNHDITDLDNARNELQELNIKLAQALEEANKLAQEAQAATVAKSRFLANMSHELRTPMNGVIGMLELLAQTQLTESQLHYVDIARASGVSMVSLINDIIDVSKIEAGKMEIERHDFNLHEIIRQTAQMLSITAEKKGLELTYHIDDNVCEHLKGDGNRLRQVVVNLGGNAVKFTNQGKVQINVSAPKHGDRDVIIRIEVRDTGIGISQDKIGLLFCAFEQADNSSTREFGGSGLGLAISKTITEMMGGNIGVESVKGQGSLFWVEIPFEKQLLITQKTENKSIADLQIFNGQRVLVVEDNPINTKVAVGILKRIGLTCGAAVNGLEALKALKESGYSLVLMDVQMPVMDGLSASRQIREGAAGQGNRDIPIVAVTANAMAGDRQVCIDAGMNDYIAKPVTPGVLAAVLAKWI